MNSQNSREISLIYWMRSASHCHQKTFKPFLFPHLLSMWGLSERKKKNVVIWYELSNFHQLKTTCFGPTISNLNHIIIAKYSTCFLNLITTRSQRQYNVNHLLIIILPPLFPFYFPLSTEFLAINIHVSVFHSNWTNQSANQPTNESSIKASCPPHIQK